jgi:signal peptidase II
VRYVIDYIDMYHESIGRWPTYNVADMAIVVGVGLILLDMIPRRRSRRSEESAQAEAEVAAGER